VLQPHVQDSLARIHALHRQILDWRARSVSCRDACSLADAISDNAETICAMSRELDCCESVKLECLATRADARDARAQSCGC
jgi:hypothetical protein